MPEEIDLDEIEEEEEPKEPVKSEPAAKKKRDKSKRYELYDSEGDEVKRLRKACPRCGPGIFMADHGERLACGKCGYTEFK